jgi:hypothetical protein
LVLIISFQILYLILGFASKRRQKAWKKFKGLDLGLSACGRELELELEKFQLKDSWWLFYHTKNLG